MLKRFGYRAFFFVSVLSVCVVQTNLEAQTSSSALISPELLSRAHLKVVWENQLPIREKESLKKMLILGHRLYAVTDKDFIISLDRDKGDVVFSETFKPAALLVGGFELYQNELLYVSGSQLIRIEAETGHKIASLDLGFGVTCPAARNSTYFYVAGKDRRLHVLRVEDRVKVFEATADNNSMITSILADEAFVVFATNKGNLVCMKPHEAVRLWQFDAFGPIAGPVVRDFASLYFASEDTNVYRVDMVDPTGEKKLVWTYQTEAVLDREPRITPDVVYQPVRGKGVTAIDKQKGTKLWSVPGGLDLLAEHRNRAYIISKNEILTVMDNISGKALYSVNFVGVTQFAANPNDSKLYVADKSGRTVCLEPVE